MLIKNVGLAASLLLLVFSISPAYAAVASKHDFMKHSPHIDQNQDDDLFEIEKTIEDEAPSQTQLHATPLPLSKQTAVNNHLNIAEQAQLPTLDQVVAKNGN